MNRQSIRQLEVYLLGKEPHTTTLLVISIGWSLLIGARMIYPVVLSQIQSSFGLSFAIAGLLITILWLFYAIGQFPAGILADKYDEVTILLISIFSVAGAIFLVTIAQNAAILFIATALCGLGMSLFHIPRLTLLTDLYEERVGSALGFTFAIGDVGQALIPPIAGIVAVSITWQFGFGVMIPFMLVIGILVWYILKDYDSKDRNRAEFKEVTSRGVLVEILQPNMIFIAAIMFLYVFIWQSFTAFYPIYLIGEKGFSPAIAGVLFGAFFAIGIVIKPVSGAIYDRFGVRLTLAGLLIISAIGFTLLPVLGSLSLIIMITPLISSSLGTGTITQAWISESLSESMRGSGLGLINTIIMTLASSGPVMFGVIADYGYLDLAYGMLGVMLLFGGVITLFIPAKTFVLPG